MKLITVIVFSQGAGSYVGAPDYSKSIPVNRWRQGKFGSTYWLFTTNEAGWAMVSAPSKSKYGPGALGGVYRLPNGNSNLSSGYYGSPQNGQEIATCTSSLFWIEPGYTYFYSYYDTTLYTFKSVK